MKKYFTLFASFLIMLCIGSVYAWSIIASELIEKYNFSAFQSQLVFGGLIAVFPVTMIFAGQLNRKINLKYLGYIAGVLFFLGYYIASHSHGNFLMVFVGISVFAGIGTGFGYWLALTSPVLWFPRKKGLITGIAAAGFGLGAIFMSEVSEKILASGKDALQLLEIIGVLYGFAIVILSNFIFKSQSVDQIYENKSAMNSIWRTPIFKKLFAGIFLGTFAGLLIIGSLKIIGEQSNILSHTLVLGVALFAIANFLGRLAWGFLSDRIGASLSIFIALLFQSLAIILLNIQLSDVSYLILSFFIGFGFGGNFVLFAKETAELYGIDRLGTIYPYVFLGYAIAGIAGPVSGGFLFDFSGNFFYAINLASIMSFAGGLLFLKEFFSARKSKLLIDSKQ